MEIHEHYRRYDRLESSEPVTLTVETSDGTKDYELDLIDLNREAIAVTVGENDALLDVFPRLYGETVRLEHELLSVDVPASLYQIRGTRRRYEWIFKFEGDVDLDLSDGD